MKNTVYLIKTLLLSLLLIGCVEEKSENYDFIQTISDPQNISAEIYVDENPSYLRNHKNQQTQWF